MSSLGVQRPLRDGRKMDMSCIAWHGLYERRLHSMEFDWNYRDGQCMMIEIPPF